MDLGLKGQGHRCIFYANVCSISQKVNEPKVFKLGVGNDRACPTSDMVLGLKGHGTRVVARTGLSSAYVSCGYECKF